MNIKEVKNSIYKIDAIKMKNDCQIKNISDPLPSQYCFFLVVVGRPNSGKTTFILNMINKPSKRTYYKKFDKVYIFSKSLSTITDKIKISDDQLYNGIDELEPVIESLKDKDDKVLLILDDVITDIKDGVEFDYIQRLIFNRRHIGGGISIILTSQVYNKLKAALRKCASDIILFQTGNKREIQSIYDDFINIDKSDYLDIIKHCFKTNHDFVFIKTNDNNFYHNFNRLVFDSQ
jgi:GTPase SAR1 family protein